MNYRGRFAPSPTGPLHQGSLIAALASYLDARHAGGTWLVRMDDLDPPREEPGAADAILDTLQAHGLHWDEAVMFQSQRASAYEAALATLTAGGHLFYCECTRAMQGPEGICCGNCGYRQEWVGESRAVRTRVPDATEICFTDLIQNEQRSALGQDSPDFIVKRKDGLIAYQLAVVVDDAAQGITHIVRGSDLLETTHKQVYLQQVLEHSTPTYAHLPVITTAQGQKFSKQNHAPPLVNALAQQNLRSALLFLNQAMPDETIDSVSGILEYAIQHWALDAVPRCLAIPVVRP
ncbi:MAG: tRNA glutamyl-Q(34) synthetase GluQRS [Halioglobus sp.]